MSAPASPSKPAPEEVFPGAFGAARLLLCLILIAVGFAVSLYLLNRTFTLLEGGAHGSIDVCSRVFGAGCDRALLSSTSWRFGIPLAGWGMVYYGLLAGLMFLAWGLGSAFELEATVGALLLAVAGALASVALAVAMATRAAPVCPLCLVTHAVNLSLVPALWGLTGRPARALVQTLRSGGRYVLGAPGDASFASQWKVVGFVTAWLVGVVVFQWVLAESQRRVHESGGPIDPGQVLAEYVSTPQQNVTVGPEDPRIGPHGAQVQLVVFNSFQCPGCQDFSHDLRHLAEDYGDRLAIVFKHYPLGTACNTDMSYDQQPRACEAAWAAEAARLQGRFWEFEHGLFETDLEFEEATLLRVAREIGLDLVRFEADRKSEGVRAKVRADVDLGNELGVEGTPSVYVNGRRVQDISATVLQIVIDKELESVVRWGGGGGPQLPR